MIVWVNNEQGLVVQGFLTPTSVTWSCHNIGEHKAQQFTFTRQQWADLHADGDDTELAGLDLDGVSWWRSCSDVDDAAATLSRLEDHPEQAESLRYLTPDGLPGWPERLAARTRARAETSSPRDGPPRPSATPPTPWPRPRLAAAPAPSPRGSTSSPRPRTRPSWTCPRSVASRRDGPALRGDRAPSTLGTFLRCFAFGHVRQLDAVGAGSLAALVARTPVLPGRDQITYLDVDDTVRQTYGYAKAGAGRGYTGVKGLNVLLGRPSSSWPPSSSGSGARRGRSPRGSGDDDRSARAAHPAPTPLVACTAGAQGTPSRW